MGMNGLTEDIIHPHLSLFIPFILLHSIRSLLLNAYNLGMQSRNNVRIYLNWVINTF